MLKILFVQKEGGIFGAENYQLNVIPALLEKDVQIEFLRLYTDYQGGEGGEFINRLNRMGVKTHEINIGKYPSIKALKAIHNLAKSSTYDIIHTHLIHADFYVTLAKLLFRGKYLIVSTKHGYDNSFTSKHGFNHEKQGLTPYFMISRWAEKRMTSSFTISKGLRDFFIETGLANGQKMKLIPYGFNISNHFDHKGDSTFRKGKHQLIIAGRLVAFKGHSYLIESMKVLKERYGNDIKLLIAGTGDLEPDLRREVSTNGLDENVEFLGYSREVGAYMANSNVVVIPSISEGFGVVFLEAFAAKTPVVSWNVPAGNELMEHGKTGYLVEPYLTGALAKQIIDIIETPQLQKNVVEEAHSMLVNYYTIDRMVNDTFKFYSSVFDA